MLIKARFNRILCYYHTVTAELTTGKAEEKRKRNTEKKNVDLNLLGKKSIIKSYTSPPFIDRYIKSYRSTQSRFYVDTHIEVNSRLMF